MIRTFLILLGLTGFIQSQELPKAQRHNFFYKINFVAVPKDSATKDDPAPLSSVHYDQFARKAIREDLKKGGDLGIWAWYFNNQEQPREEAYVWYHILKKHHGFTSDNLRNFAWAIKNADRQDIDDYVQAILNPPELRKP